MRVLHIISGLNRGGAEIALSRLLSVRPLIIENAVLSLSDSNAMTKCFSNIPLFVLNGKSKYSLPATFPHLLAAVRQFKPDIIQGWMYHGSLIASLTHMAAGQSRVIWNIRQSISPARLERFTTRVIIRMLTRIPWHVDCIVYNSFVSAHQHGDVGFTPTRQLVIPNGLDTEFYHFRQAARTRVRRALHLPPGAFCFGYLARYHPMKGHKILLDAMRIVAQSHPEAILLLAGFNINVDNNELQSILNESGLLARVFLLDEITDNNIIVDLLSSLDGYVSPSLIEGFPNNVLEAMSCGLPCVVTDAGDSARLLSDCGWVVPVDRPNLLASAMGQVINLSLEQRKALGDRSRRRVQEHYSLTEMARAYAELYRNVCVS